MDKKDNPLNKITKIENLDKLNNLQELEIGQDLEQFLIKTNYWENNQPELEVEIPNHLKSGNIGEVIDYVFSEESVNRIKEFYNDNKEALENAMDIVEELRKFSEGIKNYRENYDKDKGTKDEPKYLNPVIDVKSGDGVRQHIEHDEYGLPKLEEPVAPLVIKDKNKEGAERDTLYLIFGEIPSQ